jgi:hypothetical protein
MKEQDAACPINCTPSELSTFLLGLEGLSYGTSSSAMCPSGPSRSTPIASVSSCNDKQMDACPGSPSLLTLPNSTDVPGVDSSMSSPVGFPAPTFPAQGSAPALLARARAYGQSSPASLGRYDPATHSLRTAQLLLIGDSTESLAILPRWGWMRGGAVWGLTMSERPITASASGYWPTPNVPNGGRVMNQNDVLSKGMTARGKRQVDLASAVRLWPTPDASDWKQDGLEASQRRIEKYSTVSLNAAVRLWATPTVHGNTNRKGASPTSGDGLRTQVGGALNPTWVCWLLGWPLDWEALGPLSPQMFHAWRQVFRTALSDYAH